MAVATAAGAAVGSMVVEVAADFTAAVADFLEARARTVEDFRELRARTAAVHSAARPVVAADRIVPPRQVTRAALHGPAVTSIVRGPAPIPIDRQPEVRAVPRKSLATATFSGSRNAFVGNPTFGGFGRGGVGTGFGGVGFRNGFRGRPGLGFGFPAFRERFGFGGFGFGWGGFGWGLGFGWGPCWGAAWAWDPFCFDSFGFWPPYGYSGYAPDPYAYPPSVGYDLNYSSAYDSDNPAPGPSTDVPPGPVNPDDDTSANVPSAAAEPQVPVVIYFRDGSSVLPSDYWISDNKFYYVLGGQQNNVPLSRVDLPRTNDVNHQNGATFQLKSAPSDTAPAGQPPAGAPASPQDGKA
jgi:hypothetical protein